MANNLISFIKNIPIYRLKIAIIAVLVALGLLGISYLANYQSLLGSWLINLSASAAVIGVTVMILDIIIIRQNESQLEPIRNIAAGSITLITGNIVSKVALLYGYIVPEIDFSDEQQANDFLNKNNQWQRNFLASIDLTNQKQSLEQVSLSVFGKAMALERDKLEKLMIYHDSVIPINWRTPLVQLIGWLGFIDNILSSHTFDTENVTKEGTTKGACKILIGNVDEVEEVIKPYVR